MSDIYPETGRTYEIEAVIQVIANGDFEPETLGVDWSLSSFGVEVVKKYKELIRETL